MKINWEVNKNVISSLFIDGENIIYPWGIETADSNSFFSLEKNIGYRYSTLYEKYSIKNKEYKYKLKNKMAEGEWDLSGFEYKFDNSIMRKVKLICLEDSFFMDFVMRFRFKKEKFKFACINNQVIIHKNSNVYYQYPTKKVILKGYEFDVIIRIIQNETPKKMKLYMYVRDNKDEWVVHARMLPQIWDKEVIKLCNSWYKTKPIPKNISKILLKFKSIRKFLWYHNEKKPYQNKILKFINPNAFPMVKLSTGTELSLKIETEIVKKEKENEKC